MRAQRVVALVDLREVWTKGMTTLACLGGVSGDGMGIRVGLGEIYRANVIVHAVLGEVCGEELIVSFLRILEKCRVWTAGKYCRGQGALVMCLACEGDMNGRTERLPVHRTRKSKLSAIWKEKPRERAYRSSRRRVLRRGDFEQHSSNMSARLVLARRHGSSRHDYRTSFKHKRMAWSWSSRTVVSSMCGFMMQERRWLVRHQSVL